MQGKRAGLYPNCVLPPWPFYGQISEEKKLILMKRVRNDSLSHGFGKNGQEIYFLRWFCAPGSEPWLGRAGCWVMGRCCGCHADESALAGAVPSARLLLSPFSSRSPARQLLPGTGAAELEPCGGCRSSTGSDPSCWPHL